jgi:hypothetical protein
MEGRFDVDHDTANLQGKDPELSAMLGSICYDKIIDI